MRKITAVFDSIRKIQKFKKIMRDVYSGRNDNIPEIAKFNPNKNLIPAQVDKVELQIKKVLGSDITIIIPRSSLTFFAGTTHPYTKVTADLEEVAKYIVLPWNIGSVTGLEALKNLIDQIPTTTKSLKYTIYLNEEESKSDIGSFAELSVSASHMLDNTEQLFAEIESLHLRFRDSEKNLVDAKATIETLNGKLQIAEKALSDAKLAIEKQKTSIAEEQTKSADLNKKVSALTAQNNTLQSQLANRNAQIISLGNEISSLTAQVTTLSKNEVSWDTRSSNKTTLDFVGFTGRVVATINPANGTFSVNVI